MKTSRKLFYSTSLLILSVSFLLSIPVSADVKIIYPFAGATHPIVDPAPSGNISSYYMPFSFSVICEGGEHSVSWILNNRKLGEAYFDDQLTMQFILKIEGGGHHLRVESNQDCGMDELKFIVGN